MPPQYALPPDTRAIGSGNPPADINAVVDALIASGASDNVLSAAYAGGADPAGLADSGPAFQAAATAGGLVVVPPGTYKITSTVTCTVVPTLFWAPGGLGSVIINYTGSGDCFRMYSTQAYTSGWGGGIDGLIIDGTGASAGACGLHAGDIYQLSLNVTVRKFQGANSKGAWFDNQYFWAEDMSGRVFAQQNTTNVIFDNSANLSGQATGSYARTNLVIVLDAKGVGDGLVLRNGAQVYGSDLSLLGNMDYSTSATKHWAVTVAAPAGFSYTATNASPCVFTASGHYYGNGTNVFLTGGTAPTGFTNGQAYFVVNTNIGAGTFQLSLTAGGAAINSTSTGNGTVNTFQPTTLQNSRLNINVECNGTNANPQPGTINFTSAGAATGYNNISQCTGVISFAATSVGLASASNPYGNFYFDGPVYGDNLLWRSAGLGATFYSNGALTSGQTIFTQGVAVGTINPSGTITGMILQGGAGSPTADSQVFTLINFGTGNVQFAASGTSRVASGTACTIPPNSAMTFQWSPAAFKWYPLAGPGVDTTAADIAPAGVQSAGTSAQPPAADHVHPNQADLSLLLAPSGANGETYPRSEAAGYTTVLTSGTVYVSAIPLPKGLLVASLAVMIGSTAFASVTHGWLALLDSGRVVRAVTADQTTAFQTSFAALSLAAAASYTTTAAGLYYLAVCVSATTMGTVSIGNQPLAAPNATAPVLAGTSSTGQTTPPSTGTTLAAITAGGTWRFYGYTS